MSRKAVYRGYSIYLSSRGSLWSARTEPITPEFSILSQPLSTGHRSNGAALRTAKREIDHLLGLCEPSWYARETNVAATPHSLIA
jgi:hypothetical protein